MDMVNRLIQIAKGISLSLGETCEAVVHDGDHRIAYIANGHISGREQGQQMEESVFKYFEDETRANNGTVVRLTRKNNGELHKSTTMMFFDETGAYEAMLCFTVNLDGSGPGQEDAGLADERDALRIAGGHGLRPDHRRLFQAGHRRHHQNRGQALGPWAPKRSSCGSCASWRRRACSS